MRVRARAQHALQSRTWGLAARAPAAFPLVDLSDARAGIAFRDSCILASK